MSNTRTFCIVTLSALLAFSCAHAEEDSAAKAATPVEPAEHFTLKVLPLLRGKCLACHGNDADDLKGEFDMRSRESILKGGESEEPAIVVGDPAESPLYQAVLWESLEMPPKENDRLTEVETEHIRKWITDGMVWPTDDEQQAIREREWAVLENDEGVIIPTSGGLADEWTYRRYKPEDVWACLLYTSPSPRDATLSRMPSSA